MLRLEGVRISGMQPSHALPQPHPSSQMVPTPLHAQAAVTLRRPGCRAAQAQAGSCPAACHRPCARLPLCARLPPPLRTPSAPQPRTATCINNRHALSASQPSIICKLVKRMKGGANLAVAAQAPQWGGQNFAGKPQSTVVSHDAILGEPLPDPGRRRSARPC